MGKIKHLSQSAQREELFKRIHKKILALHNVSDNIQKIDGKTLKMGKGFDLISKNEISDEVILEPYQFMWVKSSY